MKYEIRVNHYAPKRRGSEHENPSHSVCYGFCNFNCLFCNFRSRPNSSYTEYDGKSFDSLLDELFKTSKNFKFSGGEPTLNPKIIEHLTKVKNRGGVVYLDTNGSIPSVIEKLLQLELVDVLGISLKGVTREEAVQVSRAAPSLAWDNVFQTLSIAGHYLKTHTIVTLVFTESNYRGRIDRFAKLIQDIPNVQLKINNLQRDDHKKGAYELVRVQPKLLADEVEQFLFKNPEWKGRTILINSDDAVSTYSKIDFY